MSRGINFDFDKYPTLLELAKDPSYIKMVVGPAGSAKTSGLFAYVLYLAMQQFPGTDNIRRTRVAVLRQTYQQLAKATLTTVRTILGGLVTVTDGKPPTGHANFPMPDGTRVDLELVFYALESPNAEQDALGAEFTILLVDEVSSIDNEDLLMTFISRLGRYPSKAYGPRNDAIVCALGASNGPKVNHWLYQWKQGLRDDKFKEIEREIGRPYFKLFQQPPALLLKDDGTHEPNPKAENIDCLPGGYNYYFNQLSRTTDHIKAYIYGEFVPLSTGKVVFSNFRHDIHVVQQNKFLAQWGKRGRIGLTFDFGRTPVCLAWVDLPGGGMVVFDEFMAEDISIDGFWTNVVRPGLMERYPGCVAGRTGYATGDPSGFDLTAAVDLSPFLVLQNHGVEIEFPAGERKDTLAPRLEAVRQRLSRLDAVNAAPMLQITDNCKFLIDAIMTTYIYQEVKGAKGKYNEVPTKTHVGWSSDLCDALAYAALYRVGELEPAAPRVAKQSAPPLLGG